MTNIKNRKKPSDTGRRYERNFVSSGRPGPEKRNPDYYDDYYIYDDYGYNGPDYGGFFDRELTPDDEHCDTDSVYMSKFSNAKATFYSSKYNNDKILHAERNHYVRNREQSGERKLYNTEKMFSSREINRQLEQRTGYDNDSLLISHGKNYYNDSIYERRDESHDRYCDSGSLYDRNEGDGDRRLPREIRNIRRKKHKRKVLTIIFSIVGAILLILIVLGLISLAEAKKLKAKAYSLKDEFGDVVECISEKDVEGAEKASEKADAIIAEIETSLEGVKWKIAAVLPVVGKDVKAVGRVVDLIEETNDEVIKPLITLTRDNPLEGLKAGDGFNVSLINVYLDFLEEVTPKVNEIDAGFEEIKFNVLDSDGKMTAYLDKVKSLLDKFQLVSDNMPFIRALLGDGSDRVYALVPQNNAEIRAAGGFPGIVGSITIKDGILSVGEFEGVTEGGFYRWVDYDEAGIGGEEEEIFCDWICNSYDASFIADFPKCGKIWALAYRDAHDYTIVDGTISMLPQVIQKILALLDQSITLSDGTVIDGTNATKVLVHDLYYTYMTLDNTYNEGNEIVDALLKEAAVNAMHLFVSGLGLGNAEDYFNFFLECFADKTIQIWLADEEGQRAIADIGASGELNTDENNPVVGVYYSSCDTSKDGWFLDINTSVSEPVVNSDGSCTYDVTVTFVNTMDYETYMNAPSTLVSELGGSMQGHLQLFGPAGGTISDLSVSDGTELNYTVYKNLQCFYYHNFNVTQDLPVTITCKITTAPGVTAPLKITTTPTLTAYR